MNTSAVYTDFQSLAALHGVNGPGESQRLEEVAGQFASVFTHMMLKSMRQASLGEGIFESQQSLFYRDMFDQQLALSLSTTEGVGIRQMITEHLRDVTGIAPSSAQNASSARQAEAAYSAVAQMGTTQEIGFGADTESSRKSRQPVSEQDYPLRWNGQR